MKTSVAWLQKYFAEPLPPTQELVDALTFHSSEVEEVIGEGEDTVLDVKILPDRASYGLCHRGVAYELAASLGRSLAEDPLRTPLPDYPEGSAANDTMPRIRVSIEDPKRCRRYIAARVTGVKIGPSPEWLKIALERIGQRSINNVVDATNYVMLNIGEPLHAFDAGKLKEDGTGNVAIRVRGAHAGEKITTLTGDEYALPTNTLLITDGTSDAPLGIAGVKGGKAAQVTEETTDILIEAANFEGTGIRKTSQSLKLWTDASLRFQNALSPELAAYGMRDVVALILELAGGELQGVVDVYPNPEAPHAPVSATREMLNGLLGTSFPAEEIEGALTSLALPYVKEGETFTVRPPFERRDIERWQDLAEEVGRILGYENVMPTALPAMKEAPDQRRYIGIEAIKDVLAARGFTEISTPSFAPEGDIMLSNPLQQERPFLRASLAGNMQDALARAAAVAPRVLGPDPMLKLFELGTVFATDGEHLSLALGYAQLSGKASPAVLEEAIDALRTTFPASGIQRPEHMDTGIAELPLKDVAFEAIAESLGADAQPAQVSLGAYRPFSIYPSALRDIAVWTPEGTEESEVALLIQEQAGALLARMDLFDRFEKAGESGMRISYAFRLVFQADDRTLSDADIDPLMAGITDTLNAKEGWEVR